MLSDYDDDIDKLSCWASLVGNAFMMMKALIETVSE